MKYRPMGFICKAKVYRLAEEWTKKVIKRHKKLLNHFFCCRPRSVLPSIGRVKQAIKPRGVSLIWHSLQAGSILILMKSDAAFYPMRSEDDFSYLDNFRVVPIHIQ
ncbi:hypothetical protein ASG81_09775 [Paenibacillus sp. Soil522]|nr:hypothetical protein ASG81_09775 [Paenibacillus sp. Soil522]